MSRKTQHKQAQPDPAPTAPVATTGPKAPAATDSKHPNTTTDAPPRKGRAKLPASLREEVWLKYIGDRVIGQCYCCQRAPISAFRNVEYGHVRAVAHGGADTVENLRPICESCNREMGTIDLEVYRTRIAATRAIDPIAQFAREVSPVVANAMGEFERRDIVAVESANSACCAPTEH